MVKSADKITIGIIEQLPRILLISAIVAIAEILLVSKEYKLFKTAIAYCILVVLLNFVIPFVYYNLVEKDIAILMWKLNGEYSLKYQLYFLYSAVHITVFYLVDRFKIPSLRVIIFWSIIFYLISLLFGDKPTRVILTVFALSVNHYYFTRAGRSAHPSETSPKKMILLALYSLYSMMIVSEILLIEGENFVQMPYIYSIILILAAVNLRIGTNIAYARMYGNVSKLVLIGVFFLIGLLTEEFAFQLMFYIASAVFAWYLYISNKYEDALQKIDFNNIKIRNR